MGQYWKVVNLDKREFIMPHTLGCGLKLWEQIANQPGTGTALIILTAAQREPRGGGDFDMEENWHGIERDTEGKHGCEPGPMPKTYPEIAADTIGRWAGDRIVVVGDYAEDSDLPAAENFSNIYHLCCDKAKQAEMVEHYRERLSVAEAAVKAFKAGKKPQTAGAESNSLAEATAAVTKYRKLYKDTKAAKLYRDVSLNVCAVIEHELQGKYSDTDGWRHWEEIKQPEPARAGTGKTA